MKAKSKAKTSASAKKRTDTKTKYTTFDWVAHVWEQEAKPLFKRFFKALESKADIERHYLSSLSIHKGGTNPIFKFLRPQSLRDIIWAFREMVKSGKSHGKEAEAIVEVLKQYVSCWHELFDNLDRFYDETNTTTVVRDKFERLCSSSKLFLGEVDSLLEDLRHENGNINFDINEDDLRHDLSAFKDEFAKLPRTAKIAGLPAIRKEGSFDPTIDRYNTLDLRASWKGRSRYEGYTVQIYAPYRDSDERKCHINYDITVLPEHRYKVENIKTGKVLEFRIVSVLAAAFIDLLIDCHFGGTATREPIYKPIVIGSRGPMKGLETKKDIRLTAFKSKDEPNEIVCYGESDTIYGAESFWRFFIRPADDEARTGKVRLSISKTALRYLC